MALIQRGGGGAGGGEGGGRTSCRGRARVTILQVDLDKRVAGANASKENGTEQAWVSEASVRIIGPGSVDALTGVAGLFLLLLGWRIHEHVDAVGRLTGWLVAAG